MSGFLEIDFKNKSNISNISSNNQDSFLEYVNNLNIKIDMNDKYKFNKKVINGFTGIKCKNCLYYVWFENKDLKIETNKFKNELIEKNFCSKCCKLSYDFRNTHYLKKNLDNLE